MVATVEDALYRLANLARSGELGEPYVVGGWVRDTLLGRAMREIDITAPDAAAFAARAAPALDSRVVALGGAYPLYRVPLPEGHLDVVPQAGTIAQDLARRDFTVNAMAVPLARLPADRMASAPDVEREVIDPHNGRADLASRVLRAVGPRAFLDDPVRTLRAARLSAQLGFEVARETAEAIPAALPALRDVAPERVSAELMRLLDAERATRGVRLMEASGLLAFCFPELTEGYEMEQRPTHAYTVYRHQIVAFERVDLLLAGTAPSDPWEAALWEGFWQGEWAETRWGQLRSLLDEHRVAIRLATLLHDIGKPRTLRVEADGRTRFFGHAEVGDEIVRDRLRALRFPSALVERVALLVRQHLRPGQVMSPGEPPTDRALHRFHLALGDATPDVCLLFLADSLATAPDAVEARWSAYVAHVRRIITWRPHEPHAGRLLTGRDVMDATSLEPGPAVGHVLAAVEEAVAAGDVHTRAEALDLARRLAGEHTGH